jgi:peptide deformylase
VAVREILQLGNPLLWEKSAPAPPATEETQGVITDLGDTLAAFRAAYGYGRGIAAPQIGVLRRVIFVRIPPDGFVGAIINPEIVHQSRERVELWDACFSFPDLVVKVSRAARIDVRFHDEHGQEQMLTAEGGLSELLQHEIDHLDGILAIARAVSPRSFMTRAEWLRAGGSRHG